MPLPFCAELLQRAPVITLVTIHPVTMNRPNEDARREVIRDANDRLRRDLVGGQVLVTPGIQALSDETRAKAFDAIQNFAAFDAEQNDPYGTHEFGAVEVDGERVFWKIDAYDKSLQYGSPDAADPTVTTRVLTILLASEY